MSNDKKQTGNWFLPLVGVVLGSVIIVGAVGAIRRDNWTGFFKGTTKEHSSELENVYGKFTGTIKDQSGKTYWDWLELFGILAVPFLIAVLGYQFQQRDKEKAAERQAEEAIQDYLKSMADILLNKELRKELFSYEDNDNSVLDVVQTITITILRRLKDYSARQSIILDFLRETQLNEFIFKNALLKKIKLSKLCLGSDCRISRINGRMSKGINFEKADLQYADLQKANLFDINLKEVILYRADIQEAKLQTAKLQKADLIEAKLQKADLRSANLYQAYLRSANLHQANLKEAYLEDAHGLTYQQIKSACFWDEAIYKGDESENQQYIEELKKDKSSDPKCPPNCSLWKR